jgi:hypothetical protein
MHKLVVIEGIMKSLVVVTPGAPDFTAVGHLRTDKLQLGEYDWLREPPESLHFLSPHPIFNFNFNVKGTS